MKKFFLAVLSLSISSLCLAAEEQPLWEYGLGAGWAQFPHYPASDQTTSRIIPFPTFQYRGDRVRADDREGTKAYIVKNPIWSIDFTAGGYPAAEADDNEARTGMRNLPWVLFVGPQLVVRLTDHWQFRTAFFQSVATDFEYTALSGFVYEAKLQYRWKQNWNWIKSLSDLDTNGLLSFDARFADQRFLGIYYDVPVTFATPTRSVYESKSGLLSHEITYFQSFTRKKATLYVGVSKAFYASAANRMSPLHKSNENTSLLVALTYQLGESDAVASPEEEHSLIEKRNSK